VRTGRASCSLLTPGAEPVCEPVHGLAPLTTPLRLQTQCNANKQQVTNEKKLKVGINGFGRIGRQFMRCLHGRENTNLEVVCINDSGGPKQASHLLKYDSTFGTFDADVQVRAPTLRRAPLATQPGSRVLTVRLQSVHAPRKLLAMKRQCTVMSDSMSVLLLHRWGRFAPM
jgi:Glyceraldehyde 3-phosphate dehydrogenase, NAD binding domain